MRKKLSPALVVAILFSITVAIFCVMFFTQSEMMKRVYGCELRKDIFYINDLTETVLDELEAEDVDGADLIYYAGELSRCDLGARIHEGYLQLCGETVTALRNYGSVLAAGDLSADAEAKLADTAADLVGQLRGATQYLMQELNNTDTDKMDDAYYDAMDANAKVYKRLTSFINQNAAAE
ncbi:MAG: hypothetical protein E7452_00960 [Ruminococcaceae bacterium]|nr:hypothetical protein [Oscillospiraceae bacterium]